MSTIGTPTPGTVPEPAKTRPGIRRSTFGGRNGPVWRKVCASANGRPRRHPHGLPLQGRDELLGHDVGRIAVRRKETHQPLAHRATLAVPVDRATEMRDRLQDVERRATRSGERGVGQRRDGDQRATGPA